MANGGDDFVLAIEILFDCLRFGRGFDDEEFHKVRNIKPKVKQKNKKRALFMSAGAHLKFYDFLYNACFRYFLPVRGARVG